MKYRSLTIVLLFALILTAVPVAAMALPDRPVSETERRPLNQILTFRAYQESHFGADLASYLAYLEAYLLDQFPLRDRLLILSGISRVYGLGQRDNKGYYKFEGHLSKLDPTLRKKAVLDALALFINVQNQHLKPGSRPLFALIPDKNAFMADKGGYPHYDYQALLDLVGEGLDGKMDFLSLKDFLTLDDFYRTDPHWDQARLLYLADRLLASLGRRGDLAYEDYDFSDPLDYLGTFGGQAGLPVEKDKLTWLTNPLLDRMKVRDLLTGEEGGIYDLSKGQGMDPYDLFLGGAKALLTIHNPEGRGQLVVFRDSYGSSLIPLLAQSYEETVVIDLRYIKMDKALDLVDLHPEAQSLFLFSSSVLNSPGAFLK